MTNFCFIMKLKVKYLCVVVSCLCSVGWFVLVRLLFAIIDLFFF